MGNLVKLLLVLALAAAAVGWFVFGPGSRRVDHRAEADAAAARRDFAAARDHLDPYLATAPDDRAALFLAARTARRAGDATAAEDYLTRFTRAGGDPADADLERAMLRTQTGDVSAADQVLRFCDEHPDNPAVPFMLESLAQGLMATGHYLRALVCVDRWLAQPLGPADRVQGLVWRGQILIGADRNPEAATQFRAALELDPHNAEARRRLAETLTADHPDEAVGHFHRLVQRNPDDAAALLGEARCRRLLGEFDSAAAVLARASAARPDDPDLLAETGALALDRGQAAEAESLLRRAAAAAPEDRWALSQLARCLQELGRDDEARRVRDRVAQLEAENRKRIEALAR